MLAPPMSNGAPPPRFSAPTGMPDLSMPPPQHPSTSSQQQQGGIQASRDYMQNNNYFMRPAYRFKVPVNTRAEDALSDGPGRRLRKNVSNVRRHIDYTSPMLNYLQDRLWQKDRKDRPRIQPDTLYQCKTLPPCATRDNPVDCVMSRFVRAAMNKVKCPVYATCWTPEGKRLITGASSGEFTLWNGTAFNFETILQAHGSAVRAMQWSHNEQWMISADHDGYVKYWQPNMNNVHMFIAHKDEPIRSLRYTYCTLSFEANKCLFLVLHLQTPS
ncbi:hypothetical protein L596_029471 [Steinernema carpocapsae]|uniref:Uncharacterized protein n=1 Tax=Steinernema carpocapsae TaxID=34508 RepID=A0A4U5LUR8_STECR|nr:hypothetical protein L596_029471 [Steinernema carpocapsae]